MAERSTPSFTAAVIPVIIRFILYASEFHRNVRSPGFSSDPDTSNFTDAKNNEEETVTLCIFSMRIGNVCWV